MVDNFIEPFIECIDLLICIARSTAPSGHDNSSIVDIQCNHTVCALIYMMCGACLTWL